MCSLPRLYSFLIALKAHMFLIHFLALFFQPGQENWGADHSMHALKQESNWLPFIKLKPESDAHQNKWMTQLRLKNKIDTLLQVQSKFMKIGDPDVSLLLYSLYICRTLCVYASQCR